MQINLDPSNTTPSQRRALYRAAFAGFSAAMTAVREEGAGRAYPACATIDRALDALRQVRLIAATAHELEERQVAAAEQAAEVPL